jgi:ribosome-binding factor A
MTSSVRSEKVGLHLQKALMDILKKKIKDPRLEMVTVTRVKLTSDLKTARIYFSLAGSQKSIQDATNGFKSAHGFLKRALGQELDLRYMPQLEFFYDDSFDYASKINQLFKSLEKDDGEDKPSNQEQ